MDAPETATRVEDFSLAELAGDIAQKYRLVAAEQRLTLRTQIDPKVPAIRDTGPGIAADELPRIFDRFYRIDRADQGSVLQRGSGLGLAIVKRIAELHHGQVRADSRPGGGSRFAVCFGAATSTTAATPALRSTAT